MSSPQPAKTTAVVGAGMAGLTCARAVADAGQAVTVFEKSRGVSGRLSTRRVEGGLAFDHGAQYFTCRDTRFQQRASEWAQAGVAAQWSGRIAALDRGQITPKQDGKTRLVGTPDMPAIGRRLAEGLDVRLNTRIAKAEARPGGWRLLSDEGSKPELFDHLLLAIPAPQAAELLEAAPALLRQVQPIAMQSCWAVMAAFEEPIDVPLDGAFVDNSPLSWIARNSSKPGRPDTVDAWVLHGSHAWSEEHLEIDRPDAVKRLVAAFWEATGATPRLPTYATAHRWRYAIPPEPLSDRSLYDAERRIGVAGDWCGGPRVEGAFLSGLALAETVLATR